MCVSRFLVLSTASVWVQERLGMRGSDFERLRVRASLGVSESMCVSPRGPKKAPGGPQRRKTESDEMYPDIQRSDFFDARSQGVPGGPDNFTRAGSSSWLDF